MKNKLPLDIDTLTQLSISREDNLLHLRVILCKTLELHRGHKQPIIEIIRNNKQINTMFLQIEQKRATYQQILLKKYDNTQVGHNIKPILFSFISKMQRNTKTFFTKAHSIINPAYQSILVQATEHQFEIRQWSLEKINKQPKLGTFLRELYNIIYCRFKKQLGKFINFYQTYGYLIDKRSEKLQFSAFKQQKYKILLPLKSVQLSAKSLQSYLNNVTSNTKTFQTMIKGLKYFDLQQTNIAVQSALQTIRQEGFCQSYLCKIQKISKDLFMRNSCVQKAQPLLFASSTKHRDYTPSRMSLKYRQISNARRSIGESICRNLKQSSIENSVQPKQQQKQKQKQKQQQKQKQKMIQRRSVLRQTLVQIVLNQKQPQVNRQHQYQNNDIFLPLIKDKQFRHQAYSTYKKLYMSKENF